MLQTEEIRGRRQQNAQAGRRAAGGRLRALRAHFLANVRFRPDSV